MGRRAVVWIALALVITSSGAGCAIVPRYQREALSDPAMDLGGEAPNARSVGKFHDAREAAAGGDGRPSGGGCGCGN